MAIESSTITRFDLGSNRRIPFTASVSFRGKWDGASLEYWEGDGNPLDECVLSNDLIALNLGLDVLFNGQWRGIGRRRETLRTGGFTILPSKIPYSIFEGNRFQGLILSLDRNELLDTRAYDDWQILPEVSAHDDFVRGAVLSLYQDTREGSPAGPLYRQSLLTCLQMHLLNRHSKAPQTGTEKKHVLSSAQCRLLGDYIQENLATPLRLEQLAGLVQMDKFQFLRRFNRTFGKTPHRYVLAKRLESAKRLLRDGSLPVAEIALVCGFSDQSHLSSGFRRAYALSPTQYRLQRRSA